MNDNHLHLTRGFLDVYFIIGFGTLIIVYVIAAISSNQNDKKWPVYRTIFWIAGIFFAIIALVGPIANRAHIDFTYHMIGHLFLGMLSPLLMVLARPITLLVRALNVKFARRISMVLKSKTFRFISDPIVASILNIGGLWILYTTDLYSLMHQHLFMYIFIHVHVFFAGYLFTASMISFDPKPHKSSFSYRACVMVLALAGHGSLSKYIYVNPPEAVSPNQAESAGMLMYYGGDVIDAVLIYFLCLEWYKENRPRVRKINREVNL